MGLDGIVPEKCNIFTDRTIEKRVQPLMPGNELAFLIPPPVSNATIRVCIQTETGSPMQESKKMSGNVSFCYNIG